MRPLLQCGLLNDEKPHRPSAHRTIGSDHHAPLPVAPGSDHIGPLHRASQSDCCLYHTTAQGGFSRAAATQHRFSHDTLGEDPPWDRAAVVSPVGLAKRPTPIPMGVRNDHPHGNHRCGTRLNFVVANWDIRQRKSAELGGCHVHRDCLDSSCKPGGTVRPNAFAVLRLRIASYLAGARTDSPDTNSDNFAAKTAPIPLRSIHDC